MGSFVEPDDAVMTTTATLKAIAPHWSGRLTVPLRPDESHWLNEAVDSGLVQFGICPEDCDRAISRGVRAADHFNTSGGARHLFEVPHRPSATLAREYVAHIAAYARVVLGLGYDAERSTFSRYRTYGRNLITKRLGGSYETDAEFYNQSGGLYLHVEAKTKPAEVDEIALALDTFGDLAELPLKVIKEIEYVLDLRPAYFWLVGPGTVDPEHHVFAVKVSDQTARFERVQHLPPPP